MHSLVVADASGTPHPKPDVVVTEAHGEFIFMDQGDGRESPLTSSVRAGFHRTRAEITRFRPLGVRRAIRSEPGSSSGARSRRAVRGSVTEVRSRLAAVRYRAQGMTRAAVALTREQATEGARVGDTADDGLRLAIALDGTGWHPASWRVPGARARELLTAGYWVDVVREAAEGLVDLVTIEDSLGLQADGRRDPGERTDRVRGRLDAVLVASRVAPLVPHVGLVPTAVTTHTEPFHLSKAIATLDYVSAGRAGVQVQVSGREDEAELVGRRPVLPVADLFEEAADWVEVVRRLWDSWEDDAEIRDAATGRFVDRDKLHYIDFHGRFFSVRGPSITPRPPQGQPVVAALAPADVAFELVGRCADLGFVTPRTTSDIPGILAPIRAAQETAGRAAEPLPVLGDVLVVLADDARAAADRLARLDELAGEPLHSDALVFAGAPVELADLLIEWRRAGLAGARLRPATIADDLPAITRQLVPELQRRGAYRTAHPSPASWSATLRGRLGADRPANRYATAGGAR
ncbi:Flavin-dependent oxidoreductase, luciferase family (includes alkanesulfonate monooxygenase SsuD and methylene tetrahydromethanopterin reductase) [Pseudonocardia thermophila]|uniref:Flavin-dependent oxidoreductase, luciferase family (Includes alkanesulfonate monooxygenase SsuD and methylene tetrahydromethanopterin reductase) n=1 Tax=Pseudonocardia thermophila TaxID=1848 RepID=A0A1M7BFH1_PSETH|nr:Flavin-dependent oxidoreductase, luciferase family (includes alkanesulfonate monooxygenase SsuD and methylene tetrahydromethanopterin reductase) [Pseudonocardia thermophila]